jgi:hypothetical protein
MVQHVHVPVESWKRIILSTLEKDVPEPRSRATSRFSQVLSWTAIATHHNGCHALSNGNGDAGRLSSATRHGTS